MDRYPTPEEISVNCLKEYEDLCKTFECTYVYRGESDNYDEIQSNAFRKGKAPFLNMESEYRKKFNEKVNTLDLAMVFEFSRALENKGLQNHFLAFSQHYGLPTNLVDFTWDPLIALYFACEKYEDKIGYVYLVESDCIDVTSLLSNKAENNLAYMFMNEKDIIDKLYPLFDEYEKKFPEKFYMYYKRLDDEYKFRDTIIPDTRFPNYNEGEYKEELGEISKEFQKLKINNFENKVVISYFNELWCYLDDILNEEIVSEWTNGIPPLLYKPQLDLKRAKAQSSLFIYQVYLSYEEKNGARFTTKQRIWPDKVISIKNKKTILKELNELEETRKINAEKIYVKNSANDDLDNIAKIIKKNYRTKTCVPGLEYPI